MEPHSLDTFVIYIHDHIVTGCGCDKLMHPINYVLNRLILFGKYFRNITMCRPCLKFFYQNPICDCKKKPLNEFYFETICNNCLRDKFNEFQFCCFKFDYNEDVVNLILGHLVAIKFYINLANFVKN